MNNQQVLRMYNTLLRIAKHYQTPEQLRKNSNNDYGLDYEECLSMAYENIQSEAKAAIKGVRRIRIPIKQKA